MKIIFSFFYLDKMIFNCLNFLVFFSLQTNIFCFIHKIKTRDTLEKQIVDKDYVVKGVKNLFACPPAEGTCQPIKEFTISKDTFHDCYEKNLKIYFNIINQKNNSILTSGFLRKGIHNSMVMNEQETKNNCQKLKRYYISLILK
jgi:hypothetical protein